MIQPNKNALLRLRRLATVPRWGVIPTLRQQNVAEHSFQVALLCLWLGPQHASVAQGSTSIGDVIEAALRHEESEAIVGDIPAPAKPFLEGAGVDILNRELDIVTYPTDAIKQIVKLADIAEAMLFLHEDIQMGNNTVKRVYRSLIPYFNDRWDQFEYYGPHKPLAKNICYNLTEIFNPYNHPPLDHI